MQHDFASATKVVVIGMAAAMAAAFVVSLLGLPRGKAGQPMTSATDPAATTDPVGTSLG